jgi:hypothetical protein
MDTPTKRSHDMRLLEHVFDAAYNAMMEAIASSWEDASPIDYLGKRIVTAAQDGVSNALREIVYNHRESVIKDNEEY